MNSELSDRLIREKISNHETEASNTDVDTSLLWDRLEQTTTERKSKTMQMKVYSRAALIVMFAGICFVWKLMTGEKQEQTVATKVQTNKVEVNTDETKGNITNVIAAAPAQANYVKQKQSTMQGSQDNAAELSVMDNPVTSGLYAGTEIVAEKEVDETWICY